MFKKIIPLLPLLFPLLLIIAPYKVIDTFALLFSSGKSIYIAIVITSFIALGIMLLLTKKSSFTKCWSKVILAIPLLAGLGVFGYSNLLLFNAGTETTFNKITKPTTYKDFQIQYADLPTGSRIGYFHFSNPSSPDQPIFLLHGGPGGGTSKGMLNKAYYFYKKGFDVYVFDQAGVGWSDNIPLKDYRADRMVEDLEALRQFFKLDKINLYGHSWGGAYAALYTTKYDNNVNRVVLVNSAAYSKNTSLIDNPRKNPGELQFKDGVPLSRIILLANYYKKVSPNTMEKLVPQDEIKYIFTKYIDLASLGKLSQCPSKANPSKKSSKSKDEFIENSNFNVYANFFISTYLKHKNLDELNQIKTPLLFFKGECDYIGSFVYEDYKARVENFTGVWLKGQGHSAFPTLKENDEEFNKAVDFFKGKKIKGDTDNIPLCRLKDNPEKMNPDCDLYQDYLSKK